MRNLIEKNALAIMIAALVLWPILPATTKTTKNTGWVQVMYGYYPVASFGQLPNPPKTRGGDIYKQLVWRHKRMSFLWLPFNGSKQGQYGLYRVEYVGRASITLFIPLKLEQAQKYASRVGVQLKEGSPVSYWSLYFGWLVVIPLALGAYFNRKVYEKWISPMLF